MDFILIDDEWLAMALPEGFQTMPHDELEALMGFKYDLLRGMSDTARHMTVSVTWKDTNKLFTTLMGEKSFAKQVNKTFAVRYRAGGYRCNGFFERTIRGASAQAHGFRFTTTVEGVSQEGEATIFKRGMRCYTLCYFTQSSVAAKNRPAYEEIIASLEVR